MTHREMRRSVGSSVSATHATLVAFARRFVDADTAEDLVQEAFVRLMEGGRAEAHRLPLAYLKVVVRNLAMDTYTRRSRDSARVERARALAASSAAAAPDSMLESDVCDRLSELSHRQWESLVMTVVLDMTDREAASAADVSRSAVTGSRDRALQWLRDAVGGSRGAPPRLVG